MIPETLPLVTDADRRDHYYGNDRSTVYLNMAKMLKVDETDAMNVLIDALDVMSDDQITDPARRMLHMIALASFKGEDDYDEFVHECDHRRGACSDDDPDCMWADDLDD